MFEVKWWVYVCCFVFDVMNDIFILFFVVFDGVCVLISFYGGYVLFWLFVGMFEQFYFFLCSEFIFGKVICGGVFVCFLQFVECGFLFKYGFVCMLLWELVSQEQGKDDVFVVLWLCDSEMMWVIWFYVFEFELSVCVGGCSFDIELVCENIGDVSFQFMMVLYIYLCVVDFDVVSVEGFLGLCYFDSVKQVEVL